MRRGKQIEESEDGDGQVPSDAHGAAAAPPSDPCAMLRDHQVRRRFCIRQQVRLNNSLGALARWHLGWKSDAPEKEREAIRKQADALIKSVRNGNAAEAATAALAPFVELTDHARLPFDNMRDGIELKMIEMARLTPGEPFVQGVRGLGMLGLAVIVGEAGDLSNYPNPAKLIKRLGWAPPDEYPQGEISTGRKIPRRVKGELYGVIVEPLMKMNADGKYKTLYDARKAQYLDGGKVLFHAHKLAMRVMLKRLIVDLWVAWKHETARRS